MNLLRRAVLAASFALVAHTQAQTFVLPSGLAFDPAAPLDLTYQVVPQHDEHEKVIAGWQGEKLQYVVVVEKLPPGWLDGQRYLQLLAQSLGSQGRIVQTGRSGPYQTKSGLSGRYLEVMSRASAKQEPTVQIAHHVTDGKLAYFAIATALGSAPADLVLRETRQLFETASLGGAAPLPYAGTWVWAGTAPDGRPASATLTVGQDKTFTSEVAVGGKVAQRASGFWSVSGKVLTWSYQQSDPPLPASLREDEDEILAIDDKRWVLRSKLSGKEREFLRR